MSSLSEVVEYVKISKAPGEWEYIFDSSGTNSVVPGAVGVYPVAYVDGLWRTDTGYLELYWNQIRAYNSDGGCILEESAARLDVNLTLYYPQVEYSLPEPECSNADEMIARARSICGNEYINFYNDTLAMAAPYRTSVSDDEWQNYGVEIRFNRLNLLNPLKGDGTIHDAPVTFTKPYGSTELTVH